MNDIGHDDPLSVALNVVHEDYDLYCTILCTALF